MSAALDILLVEDNEGDIEMTERVLQNDQNACSVSVAHDGLEALDFLRKKGDFINASTPHLILLDLNMPRMDGKKFLETVKQDPQLMAIPVIMLTSSQSPTDIRECYERHASCYIVKPFDLQEFAETLHQVVRFWSKLGRLH